MGLDLYHLSLIPNKEDDCWDFIYKDIKNEIPKEMKPTHTKVYHYYDWKKYKEITGFDVDQYDWYGSIYNDTPHFKFKNKESGELINILMKDIPDRTERHKVLYFKEIGYQRKGMESGFYKDERVNSDSCSLITTKDQLKLLRSYVSRGYKMYFDKWFTKPFVEGKSAIYVSW